MIDDLRALAELLLARVRMREGAIEAARTHLEATVMNASHVWEKGVAWMEMSRLDRYTS